MNAEVVEISHSYGNKHQTIIVKSSINGPIFYSYVKSPESLEGNTCDVHTHFPNIAEFTRQFTMFKGSWYVYSTESIQ